MVVEAMAAMADDGAAVGGAAEGGTCICRGFSQCRSAGPAPAPRVSSPSERSCAPTQPSACRPLSLPCRPHIHQPCPCPSPADPPSPPPPSPEQRPPHPAPDGLAATRPAGRRPARARGPPAPVVQAHALALPGLVVLLAPARRPLAPGRLPLKGRRRVQRRRRPPSFARRRRLGRGQARKGRRRAGQGWPAPDRGRQQRGREQGPGGRGRAEPGAHQLQAQPGPECRRRRKPEPAQQGAHEAQGGARGRARVPPAMYVPPPRPCSPACAPAERRDGCPREPAVRIPC